MGKAALAETRKRLLQLPPQTALACEELLGQPGGRHPDRGGPGAAHRELVKETPDLRRLQTMPGVGKILATVIAMEVGDVSRFASAARLASYAGTTPRIHSSGDKTRFGRLRPDVNRYLKWAFVEAANCIRLHLAKYADWHVGRLYRRIALRRGHQKAVGAVARHLAEATFHVLSRSQDYKDPGREPRACDQGERTSATAA